MSVHKAKWIDSSYYCLHVHLFVCWCVGGWMEVEISPIVFCTVSSNILLISIVMERHTT